MSALDHPLIRPMSGLLVASALTLCAPLAAAAPSWEVINNEDGIEVSRREVKGSPLVAFRGIAVVDAPMDRVLWVLLDNEHRKDWVDRLLISRRLEEINKYEFILYQAFDVPLIMSKRDFVYRGTAMLLKTTGQMVLTMTSVKHKDAPKTIGVRADLINSKYVLTPMEGGKKTKVDVEIHTDPKGWVPKWVVNMIQKSWPLKTLRAIRVQLKKPFVKSYPLPPPG